MVEVGLVHIIDDDDAVRAGFGSLVRSVGNDARLYGSTSEFLGSELPPVPSCLLLDVRLPGTNGLDFQASLHKLGIFLPVILVTGYGDIQMSVRGMKAGAIDFLTKPVRHQDVLDAVSVALARDRVRRIEEGEVLAIRQRYKTLTPRELEVIALVTAGKMNKQMAGELQLSEITVKLHRGAVMKKMEARSLALRAKAEALALRLLRVEKLDLLEPYDVQHACSWDFDISVNNAGIGEGGPLCCRDESVPSVARSDIDGSVSSRASFHIVTVEDVDPLTRPA